MALKGFAEAAAAGLVNMIKHNSLARRLPVGFSPLFQIFMADWAVLHAASVPLTADNCEFTRIPYCAGYEVGEPKAQADLTPISMKEVFRTNNPVELSVIEAAFEEVGIEYLIADQFSSIMEGSIGAIRRRVLVVDEDEGKARRILVSLELQT